MNYNDSVRSRRDAIDMSQQALAERVAKLAGTSFSQQALNRFESTPGAKTKFLVYILQALEEAELAANGTIHGSSLEHGPDVGPYKRTPVVGTAQLGTDGFWGEIEYPPGHGDGYVDVPTRDPNAYALRVRGDSMAPAIRNGWLVVIEPNNQIVPGELVVICTTAGRCMVKEYLFERDGIVSLGSVNQDSKLITIDRKEITRFHAVGFIVPPSKWQTA